MRCHDGQVPFDLESLAVALRSQSQRWEALGGSWHVHPVREDGDKLRVGASFESVAWLADITVWSTGEAELAAARAMDDRTLIKRYRVTNRDELAHLLDELAALVEGGSIPPSARSVP